MSDQTPDLAALEALAEAIDGEWACSHDEPSPHRPPDTYDVHLADGSAEVLANLPWELAAYVAAADPQTVLWLIREVERLTRWKAEALPVIGGLQELGSALGLPLGERITGPAALEAVERLTARAEAELASIRAAARPDRFRCCECCKTEHLAEGREGDDDLIDNHTIACQHCQDPEKRRAEKAEATIERVRAALANHPRACEAHPADDPISCGWKRAALDVQTALDGGE